MAAAAACRGSTASGGTGCCGNTVMARNTADRKSCAQICAQTAYRNCDAEVSIYGKKGKATKNGMVVGEFYNYGCNQAASGGSGVSSLVTILSEPVVTTVSVAVESSIRNSFVTRLIKIIVVKEV